MCDTHPDIQQIPGRKDVMGIWYVLSQYVWSLASNRSVAGPITKLGRFGPSPMTTYGLVIPVPGMVGQEN